MNHLCYTQQETANRLNISETVLVRLSQYFKVPANAYEAIGAMSFKDDLAFSDQDILFFRQVKERLLAGETLEAVKGRVQTTGRATGINPTDAKSNNSASFAAHLIEADQAPMPVSTPKVSLKPNAMPPKAIDRLRFATAKPGLTNPVPPIIQPSAGSGATASPNLLEIVNPHSFQDAADQSFEQYKSQHRSGLGIGKVFEKMLQDVRGTVPKKNTLNNALPPWRMQIHFPKRLSEASEQALVPEAPEFIAVEQTVKPFSPFGSLENLLHEATPRRLPATLTHAALRLKEKALIQAREIP